MYIDSQHVWSSDQASLYTQLNLFEPKATLLLLLLLFLTLMSRKAVLGFPLNIKNMSGHLFPFYIHLQHIQQANIGVKLLSSSTLRQR